MSILLPHVMDYNLDACRPVYGHLLLHLAGPEVYVATPEAQRAEAAISLVRHFIASLHDVCGLPVTLQETGKVTEDQFAAVAVPPSATAPSLSIPRPPESRKSQKF